MSKEIEYLQIPEEIKLNAEANIIFNKTQLLSVDDGNFAVSNFPFGYSVRSEFFVMIPCDFEDLEVGDTFVKRYEDVIVGEGIEVDFFVYKVLKNKRFCGTSLYDEGVSVFSYDEYNPNLDYFKVVKRSEVKE